MYLANTVGEILAINDYARPLGTLVEVETFFERCLSLSSAIHKGEFEYADDEERLAKKIVDAEASLLNYKYKSTLDSIDNRSRRYRGDQDRKELHKEIVKELIEEERLNNDEDIKLGSGGAKPCGGEIKKEKKACIVVGLPASGKSSIANKVADNWGAFVIDNDFAKRKFPEFDGTLAGASLVHEESSLVTFGGKGSPSLFEFCIINGNNIVIPKIGHDIDAIKQLRENLIEEDYEVHLLLVSADRKVATLRALGRFLKTERYVPLGLIFDSYANDPILNYLRMRSDQEWGSCGEVATTNFPPAFVEASNENSPATLWRQS